MDKMKTPDKETESFRMWNVDDKDKDKYKFDKDNDLEIDIGEGCKIRMCGFNKAFDKGELKFAFKIKTDSVTRELMLLYYIPDKFIKDETILDSLKEFGGIVGDKITIQDIRDKFPSLKEEMKIMETNDKLKKEKKKNVEIKN